MTRLHSARRTIAIAFVSIGFASTAPWTGAATEEKEEAPAEDDVSKQRIALMRERVAAIRVMSTDDMLPERFEEQHIFRYSDPARGYVDAAVWRLGPKGRPAALITTELQPKVYATPRIVYEYLSLTDVKFQATSRDTRWQPSSSALEMKPLPKGPVPAPAVTARLLQMKQIAKRFTGFEVVESERCELRLIPQPIDRYVPSDKERADGAIFLLAFGTNPEAVLFVESDGMAWTYGFARLSGAAIMNVSLDDATIWEVGPPTYSWNNNFTASNSAAKIPGIDP
jgi:hypothetical protein